MRKAKQPETVGLLRGFLFPRALETFALETCEPVPRALERFALEAFGNPFQGNGL